MSDVGPAKPPEVPNYLVWAILSTLLCCPPFGVVSIVFAAQVNSKRALGDYAGANAASRNARRWAWISFWLGIIFNLIALAVMVGAIILWIRQNAAGVPAHGPGGI